MNRFAPYLGTIIFLLLGVLLILFSGDITVVAPSAASTKNATSTSPSISFSIPTPTPILASGASTTVPTSKKKIVNAPTPIVSIPVVANQTPAMSPAEEQAALNISSATLRNALVNIICYAPDGSNLHSISGSGVVVDPKGIILTNAHIAQYFLLADQGVSCVIRTGNPAADSYQAALIYIPSLWLQANTTVLTEDTPSGTGEYDFAFLSITKSVTKQPLPSSFPFIQLANVPPSALTPVVIASYGAQFLDASQVQSSLFATIVFGSVKAIFTFAKNTIDVLALGGSAAAQEGSSGGGVSGVSNDLVGTITTSTVEGSTNTRSLDAITASYIRAEYARETGGSLDLLLARQPAANVANFALQIPTLEPIITAQLH